MQKTLTLSAVLLVLAAPTGVRADDLRARIEVHVRVLGQEADEPDGKPEALNWESRTTEPGRRYNLQMRAGPEQKWQCSFSFVTRHAAEGRVRLRLAGEVSRVPKVSLPGSRVMPPPDLPLSPQAKKETFTLCPGKVACLELGTLDGTRFIAEVCVKIIPGLAQRHKELLPALIRALRHNDKEIEDPVSEVLVRLGPDAVPELLKVAAGEDALTRMKAIAVLGKIATEHGGAEELIPVLLKALEDDDQGVRRAAASALRDTITGARNSSAASAWHGTPRTVSGPAGSSR